MGISDLGMIGGDLLGGLFGAIGQNQTNQANKALVNQQDQFNAQQAQDARNYNTQMANTTWQRGVADMQAAGLNPALAYQQGGNPVGSTGMTASSAGIPQQGNVAAAGITGAQGVANAISQNANTLKTLADAKVSNAQAANAARFYSGAADTSVAGGEVAKAKATVSTDPNVLTAQRNQILNTSDASKWLEPTAHQTLIGTTAEAGEEQSNALIRSMEIAAARNAQAFQLGPVGKVAPYLGGAQQAAQIISHIGRLPW